MPPASTLPPDSGPLGQVAPPPGAPTGPPSSGGGGGPVPAPVSIRLVYLHVGWWASEIDLLDLCWFHHAAD